jgi:AraC-like DNA-binding protein
MKGDRADWFRTRRDGENGVEALQAALLRHAYGRHAHETHAVGVAEQGSQTFHHRGSVHATWPGSVILFAPFELHDGHATTADGVVYRMLYLDAGRLEAAAAEAGLRGEIGFRAPVADDPALAAAILACARALEEHDPLAREERYLALVAALLRHSRGCSPAAGANDRLVLRVRDDLRAAMAESVTLAALARRAGISRFGLIRAFRRRFGLPPSAYLRTIRLEAAKRLLAAGAAPARAAAEAGFADQSHLSRLFKRAYGVAPGAYRRALAA